MGGKAAHFIRCDQKNRQKKPPNLRSYVGNFAYPPSLKLPNSSFFLLLQAVHTGMRAYIYNKSSVIGSQAEHSGMRTYYFSADTQEDMNGWIRAMNQAALMQTRSSPKRQVWGSFVFRFPLFVSQISMQC